MRKFLFNQYGFSLIQGMIIAAVVAGSALVGTRLLIDQKLAQKGAETRDELEDLHNTIFTVLQQRQNCRETIVANSHQVAIINPASQLTLNTINTFDTTDSLVAQVGNIYMNNNVQLESMVLMPVVDPGTRNLEITYERLNRNERTKSGYGAKTIKKIIKLRIQEEANAAIFSACYAILDPTPAMNGTASSNSQGTDFAKQMCEAMNQPGGGKTIFTWDDDKSICKPDATCPPGEIYTGFASTGEIQCKAIEDWMNFGDVVDPTAPNCPPGSPVSLKIDSVTKKVKIECTAACTPAASWTYSAWSTCSSGTQTRTATCNSPCGDPCGAQQPLSQTCGEPCTPVPMCPTISGFSLAGNSIGTWPSNPGWSTMTSWSEPDPPADCRMWLRMDTSCTETRICDFNNGVGTGCSY